MKLLPIKVISALLFALFGVGLVIYLNNYTKSYFAEHEKIDQAIQETNANIALLNNDILKTSYFLYSDNDIIKERINAIDKRLNDMQKCAAFAKGKNEYTFLNIVKKDFSKEKILINQFLTYNAQLKNSTIYIPNLTLKAYSLFAIQNPKERQFIFLLAKVDSTVFMIKSAMDISFIDNLKSYRHSIGSYLKIMTKPQLQLVKALDRHIEIFINTFPKFDNSIHSIIDNPIKHDLSLIKKVFIKESAKRMESITLITYLLIALYLISIAVVVYLIFLTENENIRLEKLRKKLQNNLITDYLTGLGNREGYKQQKKLMRHPALILININRFKDINEFYGTDVGDLILQKSAHKLLQIIPKSLDAHFYRLGGDDFGILYEFESEDKCIELIQMILESFDQHKFIIEDISIEISISIGASKEGKLLETADIALKLTKASNRIRYALYSNSMDITKNIAHNINALKQVKSAFARNDIIPYFQPIVDIKSGKITKYETLARMRIEDGKVLTPCYFLDIVKQAKLSGLLTIMILRKTIKAMKEIKSSIHTFSINISSSDIMEENDKNTIYAILEKNRDISKQITFEILESEEIEDYEVFADFIDHVRNFGCQISIDDFGSGYSNFEKLLRLNIDIIKIDGSLIKNIDQDNNAQMIVSTIISFANRANIKTVAEFVHSKDILEKVKELGVDYAQGFYLAKPDPVPSKKLPL